MVTPLVLFSVGFLVPILGRFLATLGENSLTAAGLEFDKFLGPAEKASAVTVSWLRTCPDPRTLTTSTSWPSSTISRASSS